MVTTPRLTPSIRHRPDRGDFGLRRHRHARLEGWQIRGPSGVARADRPAIRRHSLPDRVADDNAEERREPARGRADARDAVRATYVAWVPRTRARAPIRRPPPSRAAADLSAQGDGEHAHATCRVEHRARRALERLAKRIPMGPDIRGRPLPTTATADGRTVDEDVQPAVGAQHDGRVADMPPPRARRPTAPSRCRGSPRSGARAALRRPRPPRSTSGPPGRVQRPAHSGASGRERPNRPTHHCPVRSPTAARVDGRRRGRRRGGDGRH